MTATYEIGQEMIVKPVSEQSLSLRGEAILPYVGQTGTITNYHWINPPAGDVFYLYSLRVGTSNREIVLYDDEIEPVIKTKVKSRK
ncbi:hypothetical protein ACFLVZ_01935 [Chloroflexota bacterium]